jgi:hypothetical protein
VSTGYALPGVVARQVTKDSMAYMGHVGASI